jgi:hypothetical protein
MPARVVHHQLRYAEIQCAHSLSQNCSQSHFTERFPGNRPLNKQSRSPCQREALNGTNELLVIDCEDCSLLVGDTDSRWSAVFVGLSIFRGIVSRITNWL